MVRILLRALERSLRKAAFRDIPRFQLVIGA